MDIRLRVWDDSVSKMISWEELTKDGGEYYGLIDILLGNDHHCHKMLFTGLKDKNGKEGFRYDVIVSPAGCRYFIDFEDGAFCLKDKDNRICGWLCLARLDDKEIVGNIHDNPDLLEQKG